MKQFQTKNPKEAAFWDERFTQGFTPWDQGGVPLRLQQFMAENSPVQNCLIPGCGLAYEVAAMTDQGWQVTAIDFSSEAVERAKRQLGNDGTCVEHADFFTYQPSQALTVIYERAFFCALPPEMRSRVVEKWAQLLPSGGKLIGFFLIDDRPDANTKGPPFSIAFNQLKAQLSPYFVLETDQLLEESIEVFLGKEHWQIWTRI